jgi:hypothetical protein
MGARFRIFSLLATHYLFTTEDTEEQKRLKAEN